MPASAQMSRKAARSAGSSSFALPPRGLRVKNWKVLASIEAASRAAWANPLAMDRWHPIVSMAFPLSVWFQDTAMPPCQRMRAHALRFRATFRSEWHEIIGCVRLMPWCRTSRKPRPGEIHGYILLWAPVRAHDVPFCARIMSEMTRKLELCAIWVGLRRMR